jgi:hypothetical protein
MATGVAVHGSGGHHRCEYQVYTIIMLQRLSRITWLRLTWNGCSLNLVPCFGKMQLRRCLLSCFHRVHCSGAGKSRKGKA